jgi:hypothetical protein
VTWCLGGKIGGEEMGKKLRNLGFIFLIFVLMMISSKVYSAEQGDVVISEIAWMGTKAYWGREWIELFNNTDQDIYLTNWTIETVSDGVIADLSDLAEMNTATIPAHGFYLIEYKSDDGSNVSISDILGDFQGLAHGKLTDTGEKIMLRDAGAAIIDEIDCSGGWFAGDKDTDSTMERKRMRGLSNDSNNWCTNDGIIRNGYDNAEPPNPINGTPKQFSSCIEGDAATTVEISVVPAKIEISGGSPDSATVTVRLVDDNGIIDTSANTDVQLIIESGPTVTFIPGNIITCASGIGSNSVASTVSTGDCILSCQLPIGDITEVNKATLKITEIDTTGPVAVSMTPSEQITIRNVDKADVELTISESGGIAETGSVILNWRIYTSTGALKFPSAPFANLSYDSGAEGGGDGCPVYCTNLVFVNSSIDFTTGGTLPIEVGDVIKIWITGEDVKGYAFSTEGNTDPEIIANGEFEKLNVITMDIVISEVMVCLTG